LLRRLLFLNASVHLGLRDLQNISHSTRKFDELWVRWWLLHWGYDTPLYSHTLLRRAITVTTEEEKMFMHLFSDHKHLWIAFQETRHLREFPEDDPFEVHCRFCDAADEVYQPLADALLAQQPIRDTLETVLLASRIAQSEGKVF
jgi:hypothetical protein